MDSFLDFLWLIVYAFFLVAYLMVLFQIIGDLFRDRALAGGWKALWMVFLIALPLLTAVVYLIARGGGMAERQGAAVTSARAATDEYIRSVASTGPADQIRAAKDLLDSGALTAAEYEQLKARVLQVPAGMPR